MIGCDVLPSACERSRRAAGAPCLGARRASGRAVAEAAPVVFTVLPSARALEQVASGEQGLVRTAREGLILLECSTLPIDCRPRALSSVAHAGSLMLGRGLRAR